jgi:ankyrin repeat protein
MKEEYGYEYSFGNFDTQYNLLNEYLKRKDMNRLLAYASGEGELGLVIWSLKNGTNIHYGSDFALRNATAWGKLEVVKYLVKQGADINAADDSYSVLYLASRHGYLEIVKYLVECGAIITDNSLTAATLNGHLEIVEFLKSVKN